MRPNKTCYDVIVYPWLSGSGPWTVAELPDQTQVSATDAKVKVQRFDGGKGRADLLEECSPVASFSFALSKP